VKLFQNRIDPMRTIAAATAGGFLGFLVGAIVTFSWLEGFGAVPGSIGGFLAGLAITVMNKDVHFAIVCLIAAIVGMIFALAGSEPLLVLMVKIGGVGP
jgi:hypothetical protein